ncbi:MAG: RHS repeat protein [Anaerolineae bacterium]|nr:MAG: RHS repeat protein [Anaerolineae bacterium]
MLQKVFVSTWFIISLLVFSYDALAQTPEEIPASSDCLRVQAYMDSDMTPDRFIQGGGELEPGVTKSASITDLDAGDRWVFGGRSGTEISIALESDIPLRLRLYLGMSQLLDVTTVAGSRPPLTAELPENGLYTIVVSRENLIDKSIVGSYTLRVSGTASIIKPNTLVLIPEGSISRFIFYNRLRPGQNRADLSMTLDGLTPEQVSVYIDSENIPLTNEGNILPISLSAAGYYIIEVRNGAGDSFTLNTPSEVPSRIATLETLQPPRWDAYPNPPDLTLQNGIIEFTMQDNTRVRAAADTFSSVSTIPLFFFADRGSGFRFGRSSADSITLLDGSLSIYRKGSSGFIYVEAFDWQGQFVDDSNYQNFQLVSGEKVRVDWRETESLWILPSCVGIELTQGRRIIAETTEILARQTQGPGFTLEAFAPVQNLTYDLNIDWEGLEQVILEKGTVRLLFEGDRYFQTDRLNLRIRRELSQDTGRFTQTIEANGDPFVSTDWDNMDGIVIQDEITLIDVQDERNLISRTGGAVRTLETAEAAIRIRWENGGENLLLPAAEDFIEIETPATSTSYDPQALPESPAFLPAGFNNTGLECYPVNTALNLNCAENGHVNPANGNLVYSVTDLFLPGYAVDLTLTRTFNSRSALIDGPFGPGWATDYVLDFSVPYSENAKSRKLTETTGYKMALDLTQAPRGQVILTTPSGSRHLFLAAAIGDPLESDTLPGWLIAERSDDLGADWRVYRSDGLAYIFDRAGRLTAIDYPQNGALVVTRLEAFPSAKYKLQDTLSGQYLFLEFDSRQHVQRSALYADDNTLLEEMLYRYDEDGRLIHVQYADGTVAVYEYDENNNLTAHSDPRAPVSSDLNYLYDGNHRVRQISLSDTRATNSPGSNTATIYRRYSYRESETAFTTTMFDEWGGIESWQYGISRSPSTAYRLTARSTPDGDIATYEAANFLVTKILYASPAYNQDLVYTEDGAVRLIQNRNGLIGFEATYDDLFINGHSVAAVTSYRNNTQAGQLQLQVIYDPETGQVRRYTDVNGLVTEVIERDPVLGLPALLVVRDRDNSSEVRIEYEKRGYPVRRVDIRGTYQFVWDQLGRLVEYIDPLSRTYQVEYTRDCMVITDPLEVQATYCYDERRRLIQTEVYGETLLRQTTYTYDAFDRLVAMTQFVSEGDETSALTTTYVYMAGETPGHWILQTTDPYGRTQSIEYDEFDRVVQTVDGLNRETNYEYQFGGQDQATVITRTDATGLQTRIEYNLANQLCAFKYLNSTGEEDVVYKAFYNQGSDTCNEPQRYISLLNLPNMTIGFANYDAAGRPGQIFFRVNPPSDNPPGSLLTPNKRFSLEYRYNEYGRLTLYNSQQETETLESVSLTYSALENGERLVRVNRGAGGVAQTVGYYYDALDRLVKVESADGTITYTYRDLPERHLLEVQVVFSSVSTAETPLWVLYYDGVGNLREWVDHDDTRTTYLYDALSRLLEIRANDRFLASYSYNKLNQVLLIRNQYQQEYRYVYNNLGLLTTQRDFNDVVTVYTYDQFGNVSSVTDALGYRISYIYDQHNRLTTIIDPSGREQRFDWTEARTGRLRYTSGQRTINYYFDLIGRLWQIRDEQNNPHFLRYDFSGRITGFQPYAAQSIYDETAGWAFTYGTSDNLAAIYTNGRRRSSPDHSGWAFEYDQFSRLTERSDPNEHLLTFTYDGLGRLLNISAPESYSRTYTYSPQNITISDGARTTQFSYDEFFRLTARTESENDSSDSPLTTTYTYTDTRNFVLTDPFGARKLYIYPEATDVDQPYFLILRDVGYAEPTVNEMSPGVEQISGRQYRYIVNARGELIGIVREEIFTSSEGEVIRYRTEEQISYDPSGRPIRYVDAQNNPFTLAYDTAGNLITYQTPDGTSSFYRYDPLNRLIEITNPGNQVIQITYDKQSLVETIRLNGDLLETYAYNPNGTLRLREFDDTVIEYQYDNAGHIVGWRNRGGNTSVQLERSEDAFSWLVRAGENNFLYDAQGNIVSASNDTVSYQYIIDPVGRLSSIIENDTTLWNYNYSPDDGRSYTLLIGDDPEHMLEVTVDAAMRLRSISGGSNTLTVDYQVRLNENFIQAEVSWGDGFKTQIRFNRLGQVIRVVHSRSAIDFETLTFSYDLNYLGLPQSIDEPEHDIFVGYDAAYRPAITRWLYTGPEDPNRLQDSVQYAFTITYDRSGNRDTELVQELDRSQRLYDYNSEGRQLRNRIEQQTMNASWVLLLGLSGLFAWKLRRPQLVFAVFLTLSLVSGSPSAQIEEINTGYVYVYNADGHLAEIIGYASGNETGRRQFSYDSFGRLTSIQGIEGRSSRFSYDAFGRLVAWEKDRTIKFEYRYDGDRLVEVSTNGERFVLAGASDIPLLLMDDGTPQWVLYDGLGGLRRSFTGTDYITPDISSSQNVFGIPVPQIAATDFQFQVPFFKSMLYDPVNEIYIRLDGRAYDPATGRYLQRDLLGPDANGDLYAYKQQRFALPVLKRDKYPFFEGINALSAARSQVEVLYAEDVLHNYTPDISLAWQDAGLASLQAFNQYFLSQQTRYTDFTNWLGHIYNPPGVVVDEAGRFRLLDAHMPQWGADAVPIFADQFPQNQPFHGGIWQPQQITSLLQTEAPVPTWYAPDSWRVDRFWNWATDVPQPQIGQRVPALIDEYVPYPLTKLDHYDELVTALENLPVESAGAWIEQIDTATLPTTPELPPLTVNEGLSRWFTLDTIPVWEKLRDIYQLPEPPGPQIPSIGLTELGENRLEQRD